MTLSLADRGKLEAFWRYCVENQYFNLSYPESADFDYADLQRFMPFSLNNCGDWQAPGNYLLNSFSFEKEVMRYFAELFKIPFADSWGYITNGGTEGNLFGCYLGRELFPQGILYYSKDSHYSVAKIIRLLRMQSCLVDALPDGTLDEHDLIGKIVAHKVVNPIIFANIGTTLRGAVDNITAIQQRLQQIGITRDRYYLHADAALSGMILPFVDDPQPFTFADGVDSISVSGHKMMGSPIPCGIVVAKRDNVERISIGVDYIATQDKTITGSRNGHTPLMMWAAIRSRSFTDWQQRVKRCLDMAQYAVDRFQSVGIEAWRHKNSITVVFPCPPTAIWQKHGLATSGEIAHLIATGHHHDSRKIDALIDDIRTQSCQKGGFKCSR